MKKEVVACLMAAGIGSTAYAGLSDVLEAGEAQYLCQQAFNSGDFARLEKAYRSFVSDPLPAVRARSEVCVDAIIVSVASALPKAQAQAEWAAIDHKTEDWLKRSPDSSLAHIVRAKALAGHARNIDIAGAAWSQTDEFLNAALKILESQKAGARDANWHTEKLAIAGSQGWPSGWVVEAVKEAIAADPYSSSMYQAALIAMDDDAGWGDPALVEWLARLAVSRTRAVEGLSRYASIYSEAARWFMQLRSNPFATGRAQWATMNRAFKDMERYHPSEYEYSINLHAGFACLAGDRATTRALLARIGSNVVRAYWYLGPGPDWVYGRHYDACKAWAERGERAS